MAGNANPRRGQNQGRRREELDLRFLQDHEGILDAIKKLQEGHNNDIEKLQAGQNKIMDNITRLWINVKVGFGDKKHIVSYHPVSVKVPLPDGNGHERNKCCIHDHKAILDVIKDLQGAIKNLQDQQKRISDCIVNLENERRTPNRSELIKASLKIIKMCKDFTEDHEAILDAIEDLQCAIKGLHGAIEGLHGAIENLHIEQKRITGYVNQRDGNPIVRDGNGVEKDFIEDHEAVLTAITDLICDIRHLQDEEKRITDCITDFKNEQRMQEEGRRLKDNVLSILKEDGTQEFTSWKIIKEDGNPLKFDSLKIIKNDGTTLENASLKIMQEKRTCLKNSSLKILKEDGTTLGNVSVQIFKENDTRLENASLKIMKDGKTLENAALKIIMDGTLKKAKSEILKMYKGLTEDHEAILHAIESLQADITNLQGAIRNLQAEQERINNNMNILENNPATANRIPPIQNQMDDTDTELLLVDLYKNIKDMRKHKQALDQLAQLQDKLRNEAVRSDTWRMVYNFFPNKPENMTLLQLVANCEDPAGEQKLLESVLTLLELLPEPLKKPTALHILVYNRNIKGAMIVLRKFALERDELRRLLSIEVNDKKYEKTRMMGKKALFIAALSFDNKMVDLLFRKGAKVDDLVSGGNTVFHLLVQYAAWYPESQEYVKEMMEKLKGTLHERQLSLWYKANDEGQTVLQKAALLGQHELLKWILELEGVYKKHEEIFGHIECVRFDITELDYLALNLSRKSNPRNMKCFPRWCNTIYPAQNTDKAQGAGNTPSVIEIICMSLKLDKAYHFVKIPPIEDIIDKKFKHYKRCFIISFIIHLVIMALLAAQAVVKALLINDIQQQVSNTLATTFVYVVSVILFILGIIYLVLEGLSLYNRLTKSFFHDKRNMDYHVLLTVFSLCLIIDSIWSWIPGPQNIYFLAIALVVGGLFLTFFLRPWKVFSVFTAMVRNALIDSRRFIVIIFIDFMAFSFAMYVLYLPTPGGPPAEFKHLGMTVLTMFTLMLGLTDLEILTRAPFPWLTVTLFVVFVVLTYVLMFNILIAIMTSTCKDMSENREMLKKLQRLAVVVMIEHMLPQRYVLDIGNLDENNKRYFSTCFYYEKQAHLMFKKENKELKEIKNKIANQ